jgi:hypothetical protein
LKEPTLEDRFARVEKHLIGLWRFRPLDEAPEWCCTFLYRGRYYDTHGESTIAEALDDVYNQLQQLRKRKKKPKGYLR